MKLKKIISAIAAAVMAVTMSVSASAATIEFGSDYAGDWSQAGIIPKADLEAIGGDVKITLTVETRNLLGAASQFVMKPMNTDVSWDAITSSLTTENEAAKPDGFIAVKEKQTEVVIGVPADVVASLGDTGLSFQVCNVIIKSAELEAGTLTNAFATVAEADITDYCFSEVGAAPAETDTPAPSPVTGNAPVVAIAAVAVVAAGAVVASRKRK